MDKELPTLPHTITLAKPFQYGSELITTATIEKEPLGGDLVNMLNEKGDGNRTLRITADMLGWPDAKVKMLGAKDFIDIQAVTSAFLPGGQ